MSGCSNPDCTYSTCRAAHAELEVAHMRVIVKRLGWSVKQLNQLIEGTERSIRNLESGVYPSSSKKAADHRIAHLHKTNDERQYERDLMVESIAYFNEKMT